MKRRLSRRRFLGVVGATAGGSLLAACAPAAAPTPAAATAAATYSPPAATQEVSGMLEGFTWYKQSAYRWRGERLVVYIDPWGLTADLPPADLVLITHAHFDHFSKADLDRVKGAKTVLVAPADVARELTGEVKAVKPGDRIEVAGVRVEAVPAYNIAPGRLENHPKRNNWVGYVVELGGRTYYHAGDTDHLPELEKVKTDVAFLPIGGTYTMDVLEAAALAKAMSPKRAVPMHYGFVVGNASDGERFKREASPVEVSLLTPVVPFERR